MHLETNLLDQKKEPFIYGHLITREQQKNEHNNIKQQRTWPIE